MPSRILLAAAAALSLAVPATAQAATAKPTYYVSLGDSYAAGYQRFSETSARTTKAGFAYQVVGKAKKRGYALKLKNFGCGGETSVSILTRKTKCEGLGPGGVDYAGVTQATAAERFLRKNRGKVGLITVSIGGNDVTACAREADPVKCVGPAMEKVKANGKKLLKRLRKAAGPKTRIVGITYPDVLLGSWVGQNPDQELAKLSVIAFKSLLNPALKDMYESVGGRFVDVTKATKAYTPLEQTTTLAPYGEIPVAVAEVCKLTAYCTFRDIHPNAKGYAVIADLVAKTLPRKK
jgi:lysophospholipase L1-like esterase